MLNEKFFELNDEFAYIIGLLLTDGNIWIKQTTKSYYGNLCLSLKLSDYYLVEKVKNYIDPERKVYTSTKQHGFPGEGMATLNITNKQVLSRVMSYGVIPRKTKVVSLPEIEGFEKSLIRGIFDGDGSVWVFDQGKNFGLGLRTTFTGGCRNFLVQIGDLLKKEIGIIPKIYEASCKNDNWRLQYGARESLALYDYMYDVKDLYLYHENRKKIFEDWIEYKGLTNDYKSTCAKCGDTYIRVRREKHFCNKCYKERKYRPIYEKLKKEQDIV